MPTVKFKLKDPKSCEGCFLFDRDIKIIEDNIYVLTVTRKCGYDDLSSDRPQACKDKFGE